MMERDWLEFHVEPIEAEYFDESQPEGKPSHIRAIWHGIDLKTMHNDEIHSAKAVKRV